MTSDVIAPATETPAAVGHGEAHSTAGFKALLIGSIGVVYGDIGTSPLYALREAVVAASAGGAVNPQAVLGVVSLILWALIVVVTLKYVLILLRADNNGEGGTLALMALAQRAVSHGGGAIVLLGIINGGLFYGDAGITPALAVLRAVENPFFLMFPDWALIPMVPLATAATVIASQAVITGAYSLTRQAIQLGLLPRFEIRHTSESHSGQIYIPRINMLLFISVILLVLMFRSSSALASAYGISVTGTMVVTAMMGFVVIWRVWRWSPLAAAALIASFLFLDPTFLAANLLKVFEGGWVPLALGAVVMVLMYTWRRGSRLLFEKSRKLEFPLADLVAMLEKRPPQRVSGTAVFLTSDPASAPTALMHSLKHYKVLHEENVILTIETAPTPRIDPAERVRLEQISATFSKVTLRFGFMESPNVPKALAIARKLGWQFDIMSTSFFLSRRALKPAAHSGMPRWQDHLFIALSRTANDATDYFQIPSGRVVEVGTQVTI